MRLTTVILIASLMQVSAATFGQRITLSQKNTPLKTVLRELTRQSGYDFVYNGKVVGADQKVTVSLSNAELEDALKSVLTGLKLTYRIDGKIVSIKRAEEPNLFEKMVARFQTIDVRGRVLGENNQPLPGATISVKGKEEQTAITDLGGNFYLSNVDEKAVLVISFVGYKNREIAPKEDVGGIAMELMIGDLKEVIIVNKGYYNTTKEENTGSVSTLTSEIISKQPVNNPLTALQGRLPGIYISQTSGVPGASLNINIRGLNSLRAGANEPFYVVDGIPFNSASLAKTDNAAYSSQLSPFNSIRPEDIEQIEVLKDADATAIYGSRGANGVVLITTRKGKQGKVRVNLNVYQGISKVARFFDLMNTQQYLEMRNEGLKNDGKNPESFEADINENWSATNNSDKYTDWQKLLISGTAKVTNVSGSVSGGNEQTQYLVGMSYRRETTVFPGDYSNRLGSANMNITHATDNNKFKLSANINYSNNNNKLPTTDLTKYIFMPPNAPAIYDRNGQLNWQNNTFDNPYGFLYQKANSITENILGNIAVSYNIADGLSLRANIGYNSVRFKETNLIPYVSLIPSTDPPSDARSVTYGVNDLKTWITEPQLTYNKNFGKHHIDALIATTFQSRNQEGATQTGAGYSSDILIENLAAAAYSFGATSFSQYRYNAVFSRIGYTYAGKYILNLTGRRDGSSRFGPGTQFGNFGAIGAAWIFTKESWVSDAIPFLSFGKVRGSVGSTGNDQISDYNYLTTYNSPVGYYGTSGLRAGTVGNSYYRWETIKKIEIALELGFLNNRILLTTNYYRNRTSNQLIGYALPAITGFTSVTANLPAVIQNNGFEIELTTNNISSQKFSWTTSANLTIPKNKLVSYPNFEASAYRRQYALGKPLSIRYLYRYTGIDDKTGLHTVQDVNGDGQINTDGDTHPVFIGQKFYGGLTNSINYKSLTLDIFFQFVKQTGRSFAGVTAPGRYLPSGSNMPVAFLNRWQKAGDNMPYQQYTSTFGETYQAYDNYLSSDAIVTDASFIRLKNVSLSWQLPDRWTKRAKIQGLKLYMQAQNVFTISNFEGLDPETTDLGNYVGLPTLRTLTAGLQLSL